MFQGIELKSFRFNVTFKSNEVSISRQVSLPSQSPPGKICSCSSFPQLIHLRCNLVLKVLGCHVFQIND